MKTTPTQPRLSKVDREWIRETVEHVEPIYTDQFVSNFVRSYFRRGTSRELQRAALAYAVQLHRKRGGGQEIEGANIPPPKTVRLFGGGESVDVQRGPWIESVRIAVKNKELYTKIKQDPGKTCQYMIERANADASKSVLELAIYHYSYWYYRAVLLKCDPWATRQWIAAGGKRST